MPTGRELKKVLQPLIERRSDLAYHARLLFFVPLTHYLRGICFRQTTFAITLTPFCDILFDGGWTPHLGSRLGDDTFRVRERHYTRYGKEAPERSWQEVFLLLESELLPLSQHLDDPAALDRSPFASDERGWQWDRILNLCALGEFDAAEKLLDAAVALGLDYVMQMFKLNIPALGDDELKFHHYEFMRLYYLHRVFKRDRGEVIPLLHEWEAYKGRTLKLEKFWTPTPFPCER